MKTFIQYLEEKGDVPRVKKNSDGTEGDINVPFHKLHPDLQKENIADRVAGKVTGKFIPGVGAALGAYDAYGRAKQGDWAGAGLSALGGAAGLIPGVGTAASIGIAGAQALRDKQRTGSYMPGEDEKEKVHVRTRSSLKK